MAERPEKTSRKTVTLPDRLWDAIDEYRHAERIRTEVEAIRQLVQAGLEAKKRRPPRKR
jgi:metal-responsive CopG/Arc/MetJ family transcriptional regulator